MTAACTFDIRAFQILDGAAGAAGQGATGDARDASQEAGDARAGSDGAGGQDGQSDASVDGNAGAGGSSGTAGKGGAAGATGSGGAGGKAGSGGVGASSGAAGFAGVGGSGDAAGSAGAGGSGGRGGAAGIAGLGGAAGLAGIGGVAGLSGGGGTAGRDSGATGGTAGQAGGATGGGGGTTGGSDGGTAVDANDAGSGAADGGVVVFFDENFDSTLGAFMVENQCGASPPVWSNNAGYAHATDPAALGISSLYSPHVSVPPNVSEIRLRLSHKFGMIEFGYHAGQLLVSVNSATPTLVTNFTAGPYVNGSNIDADTCTAPPYPSSFDGWSGNLPEFESEVNLSGAPFNVAAGSTVSIRFRMLTDVGKAGNGWDINWVRLTGTRQ
jgi:hypothetical protein